MAELVDIAMAAQRFHLAVGTSLDYLGAEGRPSELVVSS